MYFVCVCVFVLVCMNSTKQNEATGDFETRVAQKYPIPQLLTVQVSNIRGDSYSELNFGQAILNESNRENTFKRQRLFA